jgi:DNA-binding winged helix-turn-helix (wHTH) protein
MENLKFLHVSDRRSRPNSQADSAQRCTFGPFDLDTEEHTLLRAGDPITLPPKCFDLLCLLIRSRGRLVEREHLMRHLWPDTFVEEANLSNLIAVLRKALGDSPSQSQYIQTVPKLGYRFAAPISAPVAVIGRAQGPAIVETPRAIRLIVFPFRTTADLEDRECLTHDLPDAIASSLAELNVFTVRSVQSAMAFDPVHWDPKAVARDANVDFIVTGSLGPCDVGIRAVVQLIQAESGTIQWSKSWDIPRSELVRLHQSAVYLIVHTLVRGAEDRIRPSIQAGIPTHSEAYNLYLMANQLGAKPTTANVALARDLYIGCLEKDPGFSPAWARLGRSYHFLAKFLPDRTLDRPARSAFERAFAVDPDLVSAHSLYTPFQVDAGEAENAMVRLLGQLSSHPNSPELFAALVHACRYCGQLEASLAAHSRALELDPHFRTSITHTYFLLCDYERALFWYPTGAGFYLDALALASLGREQESSVLMSTRTDKINAGSGLMRSLDAWLRGDREGGIAVLRAELDGPIVDPETRFYLARQAAKLGEINLANSLLAQSVDAGFFSTVTLQQDPWLAPLRSTAEFARIFESAEAREKKARTAFLNADGERLLRCETLAHPNDN